MASKQTRRSISVRGTTYSLLRDFCSQHERSMSDVVEELLSRILEDGQKPAAARLKTIAPLVARAPAAARLVPREQDRAAVRVVPLPRPEPVAAPKPVAAVPVAAARPVAAAPVAAERPVAAAPVAAASRPAPVKVAAPVNQPTRPVPVSNAGRPAPTRVETVKDAPKSGNDYRAIRF